MTARMCALAFAFGIIGETTAQAPHWRVTPRPEVRIGEVEGVGPYVFGTVSAALKLGDGRLIVADGRANEIRVFDRSGKHLATHGRTGSGPGEYQWLRQLWRAPGDSLIALDARIGKLTVLSPAFVPARTLPVQLFPEGATQDGALIRVAIQTPASEMKYDVVTEFRALLIRVDPHTQKQDTMATVAGGRSFFKLASGAGVRAYPIPFNAAPSTAIAGDAIVYGAGGREIERFDGRGKRLAPIRLTAARQRVTRADVDRFEKYHLDLARTPEQRATLKDVFTQVKAPDEMPAHSMLKLDLTGNLWVQHYAPPWQEARQWDVYSPDGRLIATISLPPRFTVYEIGVDYVLGTTKDELDVERVELYRLLK
jgi:hypothetical protein